MSKKGSDSPAWRGGVTKNGGYVFIYWPGHHRAMYAINYVKRADLVMEEILGRDLEPGEIVHHINGIRNDDRLENLQVVTRSEHTRLHSAGFANSSYRHDLDTDLIREEYREGVSSVELAEKYDCNPSVIMRRIPAEERRDYRREDLDDELIREEYRNGASSTELAVKYECGQHTVMRRIPAEERREAGGVKKNLDIDLIREEYREGATYKELSVKHECSTHAIMDRIPAEDRRKGGEVKKDMDVEEAKRLRNFGYSYQKIAEVFDVSGGTIRNRLLAGEDHEF